MIYEYAVDPAVVKDWAWFRSIAFGFGFGCGRLIADFPSKSWLKLAYREYEGIEDQNVKNKLFEWLNKNARAALSKQHKDAAMPEPTWFENALIEHRRSPFHALIAERASTAVPPVLNLVDADENHDLWRVERQQIVARTADVIGPNVQKLLIHAEEIKIIDPYFSGRDEEVNLILSCLACFGRGARRPRFIELHVDGKKLNAQKAGELRKELNGRRWPILPKPSLFRWKPGYLHNRVILKDSRGGIKFGDSITEDHQRKDQIDLLEDHAWNHWWRLVDSEAQKRNLADR